MRIPRTLISIMVMATTILLLIAGSVAAGPPAQGPDPATGITLAGPVASKISYQGRLTDAAGNPLDGNYNLVFQLWDDAAAGSQVGSDVVKNNVPVSNGLFTVELPVNAANFTGEALWLRIQVNGQWLSPRQELLPVPYALSLRPGAGIAGDQAFGAALNVSNEGGAPALLGSAGAVLFDVPTSQIGVFGAGRDVGVMGFSDGEDKFGGAFSGDGGVSGSGQNGPGGSFTSASGPGVAAYSESNPAIEATSSEDVAVYATTGTVPLILIQGKQAVVAYGEQNGVIAWGGETGGSFEGSTGVKGTGGTRGVHGLTESDAESAAGVFGESTNRLADGVRGEGAHGIHGVGYTGVFGEGDVGVSGEGMVGVGGESESDGGAGVHGTATGLDGKGVHGVADFGTGVLGSGETGVKGTSSVAVGVRGEGSVGVEGEGQSAEGVIGTSQATYGVTGEGPLGGVKGTSTSGDGVEGRSQSGSGVIGVSTSGDGVVGNSQTGIGVYANSGGEAAVKGEGPKGVYGRSSADFGEGVHGHGSGSNTEGVLGTSDQNIGVYGISSGTIGNAIGVWGQTNATWGLYTGQNLLVGGTCTGCTVAYVAQNAGASTLEIGDVVTVSGIAPPLKGQQTPVLEVQRATATGAGFLGVVQARAAVEEVPAYAGDATQAETIQMPGMTPGEVAPGEYLFVVVQGLVQVRADAQAGAIRAGDPVGPAGPAGLAQKLSQDPTAAPALGRALEPLAKGAGLIWVLVLGG